MQINEANATDHATKPRMGILVSEGELFPQHAINHAGALTASVPILRQDRLESVGSHQARHGTPLICNESASWIDRRPQLECPSSPASGIAASVSAGRQWQRRRP